MTIVKLPRRTFLHLAAGAAALPAMSRVAWSQAYPTRPITIIVPFPAGGPTDTIARLLSERMRASLGQTVIVENVAGAAGSIAAARSVRAAPDGYTVSIGTLGTHVLNGVLYPLQFDLLNDFAPISLIADNPLLIVAKKTLPVSDVKGLIAWLKANGDKAVQGTAGVGAPSHIARVYFQRDTGTNFQFVPYRGAGPAMQDLISGQIDFMIDLAANSLPQVRAGTIKALAVTAKTRLSTASGIPTVDEAGLTRFYMSVWHGLWVPKNTRRDVVDKLNAAVVNTLADASVRRRLQDLGQEIPVREQQSPEALYGFQKAEIEKWWPIIKAANIKGE
jgi:tripartite-type tricarboxylate transporter receptor subunit TctC